MPENRKYHVVITATLSNLRGLNDMCDNKQDYIRLNISIWHEFRIII